MVQPTYLNGKAVYFPLAAGTLIAYASAVPEIAENYSFEDILFLREPLDAALEKMSSPFLAGFSSYLWNIEYNKALAKKVKEKHPGCITVFGGHQVSSGGSFLEEFPFADILIHGEGEEVFAALLLALSGKKALDEIPGISYRKNGRAIDSPAAMPPDLNLAPSPYLEGVFDKIMAENPSLEFIQCIETNRGCPNNCAFCGWSMRESKVRMIPFERVREEIKWASDKKIEFLGCNDANFGLFERDGEIIDFLIDYKNKTGYPDKFQVSFAKNSSEHIFRLSEKLHAHNMNKGVALSFQTMNETAAKNVGRSNIGIKHYTELLRMYNESGMPCFTELIIGLPGETFGSFADGVNTLLKAGQHSSILIHICEWLPGSAMGQKEYIEKYGLEISEIPLFQAHRDIYEEDEVREYSRIITKTYSMANSDWIDMNMFSICVQCFHHLGLLRFFAVYLYYEKNVEYKDFYLKLLDLLKNGDALAGKVFAALREKLAGAVKGQGSLVCYDEKYGTVTWTLEEFAFLELISEKDRFYAETEDFLRSFGMEKNIFENLFRFQKSMVKTISNPRAETELDYNFTAYFKNRINGREAVLEKKRNKIVVEDPDATENWADYARYTVWYKRRGGQNTYLDTAEVKFES
ncbi:MAG: radical SAM protein [Oscillospiraceae bacterium]|nr:radical SAM protein [Oscillospiraceae bacterium]